MHVQPDVHRKLSIQIHVDMQRPWPATGPCTENKSQGISSHRADPHSRSASASPRQHSLLGRPFVLSRGAREPDCKSRSHFRQRTLPWRIVLRVSARTPLSNRMVSAAIATIQCGSTTAPHMHSDMALPCDRPGNSNVRPSI